MSLAPRDLPVLLLGAIFIFTSLSTGDFQPICTGIILFLEHVGGVEPDSPLPREGNGDGSRGGSGSGCCCSGMLLWAGGAEMDGVSEWCLRLKSTWLQFRGYREIMQTCKPEL